MTVTKRVEGPFSCSNCGAGKPDTTTWPQACPVCGETIWTTTVTFTADEVREALEGGDEGG